ncbi:uncharacterized protein L969DRAFT_75411 [Mixia osmundae IAM 14324]|uniref:RING-type domain-containing protein n=1 Tax=Mixia osmundae (strain CBS 9802 / IAM 14324 / JCM 22182 / KY 12970) TaxID=764103 RepID=G7E1Y6_MIXOS|nr:uncharacterized protein L969DRAFT_75411 [Mixia osmundae IAM 14324]KEI38721.1 hypothetical protein L969DRAFT_75411 [Mixia osmundae IAM 14324]GAA96823.1 hypothetical protein E5Q_03495 [Mixia osmundae IAM 14324]
MSQFVPRDAISISTRGSEKQGLASARVQYELGTLSERYQKLNEDRKRILREVGEKDLENLRLKEQLARIRAQVGADKVLESVRKIVTRTVLDEFHAPAESAQHSPSPAKVDNEHETVAEPSKSRSDDEDSLLPDDEDDQADDLELISSQLMSQRPSSGKSQQRRTVVLDSDDDDDAPASQLSAKAQGKQRALEERPYKPVATRQSLEDCAICMDSMDLSLSAMFTCGHIFHLDCIQSIPTQDGDDHGSASTGTDEDEAAEVENIFDDASPDKRKKTLKDPERICPHCRQVNADSVIVKHLLEPIEGMQAIEEVLSAWFGSAEQQLLDQQATTRRSRFVGRSGAIRTAKENREGEASERKRAGSEDDDISDVSLESDSSESHRDPTPQLDDIVIRRTPTPFESTSSETEAEPEVSKSSPRKRTRRVVESSSDGETDQLNTSQAGQTREARRRNLSKLAKNKAPARAYF